MTASLKKPGSFVSTMIFKFCCLTAFMPMTTISPDVSLDNLEMFYPMNFFW